MNLPASSKGVNETKTIAIVGASGYIGKFLVEKLRRLGGHKIKLLVRSLDQCPMRENYDLNIKAFKGDGITNRFFRAQLHSN